MDLTDSVTDAMRNQAQSPFLRLPAELRNHIYGYAFNSAELHIRHKYQGQFTKLARHICRLSQVCRQIRHETTSFLDSYTELKITTLLYPRWFGWTICFRKLSFEGFTFVAVLLLELPEDLVLDMIHVYSQQERRVETTWLTRLSAELFPSLEVVILPVTFGVIRPIKDAIRWAFVKPELRIEFRT